MRTLASWWACWNAWPFCVGSTMPVARCASPCSRPLTTLRSGSRRWWLSMLRRARERSARIIDFAASARCRHLQVAEHFGETVTVPCGMCDVCDPVASADAPRDTRALPDDIARAIIDAVEALSWPVGVTGLAATLKGSIDAPPSAQRSAGFGVLAAARGGTIKRWVGQTAGERKSRAIRKRQRIPASADRGPPKPTADLWGGISITEAQRAVVGGKDPWRRCLLAVEGSGNPIE